MMEWEESEDETFKFEKGDAVRVLKYDMVNYYSQVNDEVEKLYLKGYFSGFGGYVIKLFLDQDNQEEFAIVLIPIIEKEYTIRIQTRYLRRWP